MKKSTGVLLKRYWFLYLLVLPSVTLLLIYNYYPMLLQCVLAFKEYRINDGIWGSPWVYLDNFKRLVTNHQFSRLLFNTVYISVLRIFWEFWPPILLAILLYDLRSNKYRKTCQAIVYIPHFFSWVIVYGIAYAFFSNSGFVNTLISNLGGSKVNFLMSPRYCRPILIGTSIWKGIGWGTIIYLAALTNIDTQLIDAAKIDGCGPLRRIKHVLFPGILPVTVFLFTLSLGNIIRGAGTEQILLFYNPATYQVADVIDTWVYRQGLGRLEYEMATAMQFFQSFIGMIMVITANSLSKRVANIGIW